MTHGVDFITVFSTFTVLSATAVGLAALPWTDEALKRSAEAWSVAARLPIVGLAVLGESLARTQWALAAVQQVGSSESA